MTVAVKSQKIMRTYYDYRNTRIEKTWQFSNNGFKNGYFKHYYRNGLLFEVGQYKNDLKNGIWKIFDEDGKLRFVETYKNGQEDGLFQVWGNGPGYHNLLKDRYHDSYGIYREVSYYGGGIVESDIRRDGECKIFYNKNKPAKVWQNQDAKPIPSSIKIWTIEGKEFPMQKMINGVNYTGNADVEYDWSAKKYYITPPTKYTGDSSGWKITVRQSGAQQYRSTLSVPADYIDWDGILGAPLGVLYTINKKNKDDTIIEMSYLSKNFNYDLLEDLIFLNDYNTYLIKTVEFYGSYTKITFFDINGKILETANGVSNAPGHWSGRLDFKPFK